MAQIGLVRQERAKEYIVILSLVLQLTKKYGLGITFRNESYLRLLPLVTLQPH